MGKVDSVEARKESYKASVEQSLSDFGSGCFDDGAASVPPADADEQAKIDAAVLAQKEADQVVIDGLNGQLAALQAQDDLDKQAAVDAKAAGDLAVADALKQVEDLKASKAISDQVAADLNAHIGGLQGVIDELHALFPPAQP